MRAPFATLLLLSLALAWAVFFKGGVWPHDWAISLAAIGFVSFCYWIFSDRVRRAPPLNRWPRWSIVLFPAYLAFQLLPLPLPVLGTLSPERAHLAKALAPIIPGVHAAPLSVNPPAAVFWFFSFLSYTAIFLLIRELAWRFSSQPWTPVIPLIAIAALEAALGMFQVFTAWPNGQANGTYVDRDHFCGLLEMILPFAVLYGLTILRRSRARFDSPALPAVAACGMWALAALLLLAIIYSLSRMGFIDALCALFLMGALTIGPRLPSRKWRWASLGVIAAAILLMLVFFPPGQLIERFAAISSSDKVSADSRLGFWKETLPLISEFTPFGSGLGGFQSTFMKHQTTAAGFYVDFAHNDYLQFLAELGIIGFALLAAIIIGVLTQIFRGILKAGDEERRLLLIACAASFFAILLHSFVDFNMYIPANAMTLAWVGAVGSLNGLD